jgi:MFS transporter, ACS family, hexuronate transporter
MLTLSTDPPSKSWLILSLAFLATVINYADRQIIALLKPLLQADLGWTDGDYAKLVSAFQLSAALAFLGAGWFVDKVGVRRGYAWGVAVWSAAGAAHAFAASLGQFMVARVVLGASEAVNTPAAVKTAVELFGPRRRSMAIGIVNAAPNVGAILTPLLVPVLAITFGWRKAFLFTGLAGFAWLACWLLVKQPRVEETEAQTKPSVAVPSWWSLLRSRQTWVVAVAKALADQVWWFLLFWMPDFLTKRFHLDLSHVGLPVASIYLMAALGSLSGGWLPGVLAKRTGSAAAGRKRAMLIYALLVTPLPLALVSHDLWMVVFILGVALAAHQGFSTNIFGFAADTFPTGVLASVIGIGAFLGNLAGMAMLAFTGWVLHRGGGYLPMFLISATSYLIAWVVLHYVGRTSTAQASVHA